MESDRRNAWSGRSNKIANEWRAPEKGDWHVNATNEFVQSPARGTLSHAIRGDRATVRCPQHRTFLLCYALLGLFYPKNFQNCGGKWWIPVVFYSTAMLILMIFNMLRILATCSDESIVISPTFFSKVSTITWMFTTTVSYLIHYIICFTDKHGISSYYRALYSAVDSLKSLGMEVCWRRTRIMEVMVLVVGFIFFIANVGLFLPSLLGPNYASANEYILRVLPGNGTNSVYQLKAMSWVTSITSIYLIGSWMFPAGYVIVVTAQMSALFDSYNKRLEELAASDPQALFSNIGAYRVVYFRLRQIVSIVDGYFRFTLGLHFIAYLGMSMLQLYLLISYTLLWEPENRQMLGGMIQWFVVSVTIVLVEFACSCIILGKAKDCVDHLQLVSAESGCVTSQQLSQLHLLLSGASESTGFTIFSFFLVSNDAVFAVVGTWLTYFLLILQFSPPTS